MELSPQLRQLRDFGSEMTSAQNGAAAGVGPLQAELTLHAVETLGDYSLHIAFDFCDRNVNAETALHFLTHEYDKDATWADTPTTGVVDKLATLARSQSYHARGAELQAQQQANYKRARAATGVNLINALDRLIALDRKQGGA